MKIVVSKGDNRAGRSVHVQRDTALFGVMPCKYL